MKNKNKPIVKRKPMKEPQKVFSGDMPYVGHPLTDDVDVVIPPVVATFELPSRDELLSVRPGDDVKVMFAQAGRPIERMWVKVTSVMDGDEWTGMLDNEPVCVDLECGMALSFHPLAVIGIQPNERNNNHNG